MRMNSLSAARLITLALALVAGPLAAPPAVAGGFFEMHDPAQFLPPIQPWDGASRKLALAADHPWATPFEASGMARSPSYGDTVAWLERLAAATLDVSLVSLGVSAEGREIVMAVAARGVEHTPKALRASGRPLVLAQAGIHSGEIDGKDAGMMLLRDMTVLDRRRPLLDRVSFLLVPILSVDGHERSSRFSRVNQRGPEEMGWRTNARNLNLNRDYAKLETEGVRAVVAALNAWQPDLYLDLHVTDGVDYQYDATWGASPDFGWSPHSSRWIEEVLEPAVNGALERMGHVPGPLLFAMNGQDFAGGAVVWMGSPRFSTTYGAARHLPSILLENHSLKPFERRVLGTYVFLDAVLDLLGRQGDGLARAAARDRATRPDPVVLSWTGGEGAGRETHTLKAIRSQRFASPVTGSEVVRWTGEPIDQEVVFSSFDVPAATADRPAAYVIPAAWSPIADKLRQHGIEVETLAEPTRVRAEVLRLPAAALDSGGSAFDHHNAAYEGRVRVAPGEVVREMRDLDLSAGSFRVDTDQPLGTLAVLLLEPDSPDSLFQWGYFLEILSRTEYVEAYVMEPMGRAMLADDPALRAEFEARLAADPEFAGSPRARLMWLYERTPFYDDSYRLYPVGRVLGE